MCSQNKCMYDVDIIATQLSKLDWCAAVSESVANDLNRVNKELDNRDRCNGKSLEITTFHKMGSTMTDDKKSRSIDEMDSMLEFCANIDRYRDRFTEPKANVFDWAKINMNPQTFNVQGVDLLRRAIESTIRTRGRDTLVPTFAVCDRKTWSVLHEIAMDQYRIVHSDEVMGGSFRNFVIDRVPVFWDMTFNDRNERSIFIVNWPSMRVDGPESHGVNAVILNTDAA